MSADIAVLRGHADWMSADERAALAASWGSAAARGTLLLATCHRVELYGDLAAMEALSRRSGGARLLRRLEAVRHLVTVAVGRDSAVVGEDQILHQLRGAVRQARAGNSTSSELDRAIDMALRAGRRARSWLPGSRPTLVDVALSRVGRGQDLGGTSVLVVGAGLMGSHAVRTVTARGASVLVSSRTRESSRVVADRFGARDVPLDPGAGVVAEVSGVIVALSGPWPIGEPSRAALAASGAWLIDLSAPPAVDNRALAAHRGPIVRIDDLARPDPGYSHADATLRRLDGLIDETVEAYARWADDGSRRMAARALTERAVSARSTELEQLWHRLPMLDDGQRAEVERMAEHLTDRLLRDPLEQLARDADGRRASAARELFRL